MSLSESEQFYFFFYFYFYFFFFFEYKWEFIRRIQFLAGTPTAKMSYELEAGPSAGHIVLSPQSFTSGFCQEHI